MIAEPTGLSFHERCTAHAKNCACAALLITSMRDTTTREAPDLLHSVRGMSDSGVMTRTRAAVGSAA
jgi:hypothetical protein